MSYASVPCPACGVYRTVDWTEYTLMLTCHQFMCLNSCGMDIPAHPMWVFMNKIVLDGSVEE